MADAFGSERFGLRGFRFPNTRWAVAKQGKDGSVTATASTLLEGGLFWSIDENVGGTRLILGTSPGDVVRARTQATTLDEPYVRTFAMLSPASEQTPYAEVKRLRPGVTAHWPRPGSAPRQTEWSGPSTWPVVPKAEGPDVQGTYLANFDAVVSEMTAAGDPIAAAMSGGLDSSFVVAALAMQTTPDRPVHAFSHAPHPDAQLEPSGDWDPDDSPYALAMQRAYPGRVIVHRVINADLVASLDAASDAARRSWLPTFNPGNQVWISQIESLAAQLGASRLFSGTNGNPAFSHEPTYALRYYLRRADLRTAAKLLSGSGRPGAPTAVYVVASPGREPPEAPADSRKPTPRVLRAVGLPDEESKPLSRTRFGRPDYLEWLAGSRDSLQASLCPAGEWVPSMDPFRAATVMEMAASITPREWSTGPYPRGFARRLGEGRVPDEIRLRTRGGGQAMDTWFVTRNLRDRYFDEIRQLESTPVLGGWVDVSAIEATVSAWPWGEVRGPGDLEVIAVERLLALAEFVRMTRSRLKSLP